MQPDPIMCFAWSFVGAPRSGAFRDLSWIAIPNADHLASTLAVSALERARAPRVTTYRCALRSANGIWICDDAAVVGVHDVESALAQLASYCARDLDTGVEPTVADDLVRRSQRAMQHAVAACGNRSLAAACEARRRYERVLSTLLVRMLDRPLASVA